MLNKTAYLNGLTKEKEIEIYMESHKHNLRNMKSINHNEPEVNPIEINKNKAKYLQGRRAHEINIENEVLTQKIQKIVNSSRNPKYYSSHEKYSRSLNGYIKRTTQSQVNEENLKLLVRLEDSKPTYSTKKYLEEFEHLKQVEKKMSTAEFYLTDSPTFRKRKLNTNRSFLSRRNSSFGENSSFMGQKSEIVKDTVTLNDGKMWEIKIYKDQKEVKITGQIINSSNQKDSDLANLKLISIPNIEANIFLRKHCDNRLNFLIKHLKVDEKDGSLILIVPQNVKSPSPSKLMNPEERGNIEKKLMNIELAPPLHKRAPPRQIFNTVNKKPLIEELPKFKSEKDHTERHNESKKSEESIQRQDKKEVLPKIESNKNVGSKKEEIVQKAAPQNKKQKVNTKKSSVGSIKSSEKVNRQVESRKESEKGETIKKEEKVKNEEEENYEQEKFEESMNKKEGDSKKEEQKKEESINDQQQESGQNNKEVKLSQEGVHEQVNQIKTPIEESMDKQIEGVVQNKQENEVNNESPINQQESEIVN